MERLQITLDQQLASLRALEIVIVREQQLLCAGPIQESALQPLTEQKGALLATLAYLDQNRLRVGSSMDLTDPYLQVEKLAECWQDIQQQAQRLYSLNAHNGVLLIQHIAHNAQALAILSTRYEQPLYGSDGQSHNTHLLGQKISV